MDEPRTAAFDRALSHWREVFTFARQLVGDRGRAEDLAQEAYLRLHAIDRPADDPRPVRSLLFTIVRNLVRSDARKRGLNALDFGLHDAASDRDSPLALTERSEERTRVRAVLETLRPAWRASLFLADGLGCSYAEIAKCLDTSEDVIRTTLHRARERVRAALAKPTERGIETDRTRLP